mmetsp:Transcript_103998/g.294153  ORF Transcript_103998/g.294153 Transcript_103998/m.294153 type:complete len:213 (+) Transcript_103998:807-1445(+)
MLAWRARGRPLPLHRGRHLPHAARLLRDEANAALGQCYREGLRKGVWLLRGDQGRRGVRGARDAHWVAMHDGDLRAAGFRPRDALGLTVLLPRRCLPHDMFHEEGEVEVAGARPRLLADGRARGRRRLRQPRSAPQDSEPPRQEQVAGCLVGLEQALDPAPATAAGLPGGRQSAAILHGLRGLPAGVCPLHNLQNPQQRVARGQRASASAQG